MKISDSIVFCAFNIEKILKKYGKYFLKVCGNLEWCAVGALPRIER